MCTSRPLLEQLLAAGSRGKVLSGRTLALQILQGLLCSMIAPSLVTYPGGRRSRLECQPVIALASSLWIF